MKNYYYTDSENRPAGPVSYDELVRLCGIGTVRPETYVIEEGHNKWISFSDLSETQLAESGSIVLQEESSSAVPLRFRRDDYSYRDDSKTPPFAVEVAKRPAETVSLRPISPMHWDANSMMLYESAKKSDGRAYFLLGALGYFGGHRFYMDRSGSAVTMLVISIFSIPLCFVFVGFFGLFAVALWILIDAFTLHDWIRSHNTELIRRISSQ